MPDPTTFDIASVAAVSDGQVCTSLDGHVLTVTINRPRQRNAINQAVCRGVGTALAAADASNDVRAVVLTGAGDAAFSAGADLKALAAGEDVIPAGEPWQTWGLAGLVGQVVSVPVIAAVNGAALGGGAEIALACDLIVAGESAVFGLPEVQRGMVAGAGGAFRLVQQLPGRVALQMLMTGEPITSGRAQAMGLVNEVVADRETLTAAQALAGRIARNAPLAVRAAKRIALGIEGSDRPADREHWERTGREVAAVMLSEDAAEGPRAFAEKRPPVFVGR
ncbi:enoyl-CoA hydratase-related protein [Streptomyces sp. NPDC007264]|uniref:enoyl-CoA hydratase-related protein n=1 Tax=Streptomyces sp. NPDC007264 TaxID=3364777 RepID=UPI0036D8E5D7